MRFLKNEIEFVVSKFEMSSLAFALWREVEITRNKKDQYLGKYWYLQFTFFYYLPTLQEFCCPNDLQHFSGGNG